jgi:RND superfamily putative drug exporter
MSSWAVRRPLLALILWVVVLVGIGMAAAATDGRFNDSFALPGVQSTVAQDLLTELEGTTSADATAKVIWSPASGKVTDRSTREAIRPTLQRLAELEFVSCVVGPYGDDYGRTCPTATPVDLRRAVLAAFREELAKKTGIPADRLSEAAGLLDRIEPLEDADPRSLAQLARALPAMARLAQAAAPVLDVMGTPSADDLRFLVGIKASDVRAAIDAVQAADTIADLPPALLAAVPGLPKVAEAARPTLDALAKLTPSDLAFLEGLTESDIQTVTDALGGLQKFAQLPPETLKQLAEADPSHLAALASALPSDVTKAADLMAQVKKKAEVLAKAATATQAATSAISPDERVAYATVTVVGPSLTARHADRVLQEVAAANTEALTVGAQGSVLESGVGGPDSSQGVGLLIAIIILLLVFGSLVAAGLPIVVAITGLIAGQLLVVIAAHFMDVATFAPSLAAMIGLGVGIDYALFIMNRFTQASRSGKEPRDAALEAVGTAGKAVAFAGTTVIIALLGMFVLRINFFNGLSVAAAAAVLMVMASALWMLPALLSLLGSKSLAIRMPWARHPRPFDPQASRWARYGALLQRAPAIPAVLALALVGLLASPALGMQLGFPDDSSQAKGSPLRTGFDLLSAGYGPGVNGPFYIAVEVPKKHDYSALRSTIEELARTPGVASTVPTAGMLPLMEADKQGFGGRGDRITSVIVQPTTTPSDARTAALLDRIRSTTAQEIKEKSGTVIYVGGSQAVSEDFTSVLESALPVFLLLVVGLGFLALMLLFHSLLIPLTAAFTSLLSFAGALGVTVAVFQNGVADSLLGVTGTGPILPFLPIMVFAILFGLSMDYQVFLVSRMREEWDVSKDNSDAVRLGLAGSGRVVVAAATIMISVFVSFIPTPIETIKLFGVALAAAVFIDAFIVRLVLVPSVMSLFGRANWWLPRWLDRVLPRIRLE